MHQELIWADLEPGEGDSILYHGADWPLEPEHMAMIAAAPDLLAALKDGRLMFYAWKAVRTNMGLLDNHSELNDSLARIDAAIAKAEGGAV